MLTQFRKRHWGLILSGHAAQLIEVRGMAAAVGLLNHQSLPHDEGLLFRRTRVLHTIGMNMPICVLGFASNGSAVSAPTLVPVNHLVLAPRKAKLLAELNYAWAEGNGAEVEGLQPLKLFQVPQKLVIALHAAKTICKILLLATTIAVVFSYTLVAFAKTRERLELSSGEVHELNFSRPPARLELSDERIVALERVGNSNSVKVTAKAPGKTSLQIRYPDGSTQIYDVAVAPALPLVVPLQSGGPVNAASVLSILKKNTNLAAYVEGERVAIGGEVRKVEEFRTVVSLAAAAPQSISVRYRFATGLAEPCLRSLEEDLKILGAPELRVVQRDGTYFLLGSSPDVPTGMRAYEFAHAVLPNLVDGRDPDAGSSDEVMIELRFLEVARADGLEVGLGLTGERGPAKFSNGAFSNQFGDAQRGSLSLKIAPVDVVLRALGRREFSREIARPLLRTRNGRTATFLAGGEVPVLVLGEEKGEKSRTVEYKPYGVQLSMTPSSRRAGTIWIDLMAETSRVASALDVSGLPSFITRRLQTSMSLEEGQTALLGGLTEEKDAKSVERFPFLADIPVLGELFKSRKFAGSQSELWVLLTAERNPSHAERVRKAEDSWLALQKFLPASIRD